MVAPPSRTLPCNHMIAGVWINGRHIRQGSHVEYVPVVARRFNADGPGGLSGSSESHCVGTVRQFHVIAPLSPEVSGVFVELTDRPVLEVYHSLRVISSLREDQRVHGFAHAYSEANTLLHVDAIVYKVKLVPHFDEHRRMSRMCCVRMWDVR